MKNGLIIDEEGNKEYYLNDELHREDGPAEEWADGSQFWFLHGLQHRVGVPAEVYADGSKFWFLHGLQHRVDGPAEEWDDGDKFWYLNGLQHRADGPAEEHTDGTTYWYLNGKELNHPEEFKNMEEFIQKLNNNEEYSLQWISDFNGIFEMIKNPTDKQNRLHSMRWKI